MSQEIPKVPSVLHEGLVDQADGLRKKTADFLMGHFNEKRFIDVMGQYTKLQFGKEIDAIYTAGSFTTDELKKIRDFAETILSLPEGYSVAYNGPEKK